MPSDFPSTQPAFTMNLNIGTPLLVGSVSRGFDIELDASFVGTGNDYIHNDADGRHMRLDAHGIIRAADDSLIYLKYYGIIEITPGLSAILGGSSDAQSTNFGHSFIHIQFETGAQQFKSLETSIFVGAGRFHVDISKFEVSVEYKISKVVAGGPVESKETQTAATRS